MYAMNAPDNWIEISACAPTMADMPAWFGAYLKQGPWMSMYCDTIPEPGSGYTHWQSVKPPAPPPRKQTHRDQDLEDFRQWWIEAGKAVETDLLTAWLAAVAKEREKQRKLTTALASEMRQEAKEWRKIFKMAAKLADDPKVYSGPVVAYAEILEKFADKLDKP